MQPAITESSKRTVAISGTFFGLIPGILLLAVIGYAGKVTEQSIAAYGKAHHLALPNIEYVLWAILFGLIVSNTIGIPAMFRAGVDTYEFWLKIGIVFQGVRFMVGDVLRLGGISLVFVVVELGVSIAPDVTWLGRRFGLDRRSSQVCSQSAHPSGGVSAIIASRGAIDDADDEEVSYAIGAILALGAFSLLAFLVIGHALHMSDSIARYVGRFGWAVDNTAEATRAAGALYSEAAGKFAVLAKTTRNATIGVRCACVFHLLGEKDRREVRLPTKAHFCGRSFLKLVLGLIGISLLASLSVFDKAQITDLANLRDGLSR